MNSTNKTEPISHICYLQSHLTVFHLMSDHISFKMLDISPLPPALPLIRLSDLHHKIALVYNTPFDEQHQRFTRLLQLYEKSRWYKTRMPKRKLRTQL